MAYRGFEIVEVWTYNNGKSDFEVYDGEEGHLHHGTTLEKIKSEIDEYWDDVMEQDRKIIK